MRISFSFCRFFLMIVSKPITAKVNELRDSGTYSQYLSLRASWMRQRDY